MSSALDRQMRLEAARAKAQDYLYDRRVNHVPVRDLAKRAGICEADMLEILKAHGYSYQQARQDDRLSLMKPYGTTRSSAVPRVRREKSFEEMMEEARNDH